MSVMNVMLLTAGFGTRLSPYTDKEPKPAIPFMTVPMAAFPLMLIEDIEIKNLVYNTHHLPEKIVSLFQRIKWPCKRLVGLHEKSILGSGGGVANAEKYLVGKGSFLVLNGDEVILPNQLGVAKELVAYHRWHGGIATLLTTDHPEVGTRFGGAWCEGDQVKAFSKAPISGLMGRHFLGVMVLSDRIFNYFKSPICEENILYETLTKAMQNKEQVFSYNCDCQWFETGNPQDFITATERSLATIGANPRPQWAEHLIQTVRLHSEWREIIEKDYPNLRLMEQLRKFC
jgi:mannose-1-phosphate guanylyltransferase